MYEKNQHFVLFIIIYLHYIISCRLDFVKTLSELRAEKDKYVVHDTDRLYSDKCSLDKNENRNCSSNTVSNYMQVLYSTIYIYVFKTICMF